MAILLLVFQWSILLLYDIDCEHENISEISIKRRPGDSYRGPDRISCDFALNLFILADNLLEVVAWFKNAFRIKLHTVDYY